MTDATPPVEEAPDDGCTCTRYVVDYSDPDRYHPENVDRELTPGCPEHDPAPPVEEAPRPTDAEIVAVMAEATCPREHLIVGGHADCLADATAMWEAAKPLLAARPVSGDVADPKRDCYGEGNACYLHDRLDCPGAVSGGTEGREALARTIGASMVLRLSPQEIADRAWSAVVQPLLDQERRKREAFQGWRGDEVVAARTNYEAQIEALTAERDALLDQAAEDRAEVERLTRGLDISNRSAEGTAARASRAERERDRYRAAVEAVEALIRREHAEPTDEGETFVTTRELIAALASTTERPDKPNGERPSRPPRPPVPPPGGMQG